MEKGQIWNTRRAVHPGDADERRSFDLEGAVRIITKTTRSFSAELDDLLKNYAGRPSLLYYAEKMTKDLGGAKIYLKREDLNHTGSHKINNVLGQVLLAKKDGQNPRHRRDRRRTARGCHRHSCSPASDMECEIFMGKEDTGPAGAECLPDEAFWAPRCIAVTSGTETLKDAVNETMREWTNRDIGHPLCTGLLSWAPIRSRPSSGISSPSSDKEIKGADHGKGRTAFRHAVFACVGGGSNAMGAVL